MKIYKEIDLEEFEAWAGAKETMHTLTVLCEIEDRNVFNDVEACLVDVNDITYDETELNDILWFETDWIAECLGYKDYEELYDIVSKYEKERG